MYVTKAFPSNTVKVYICYTCYSFSPVCILGLTLNFVLASRAPPAQNGGASFGYPSPGVMNGYGPPPVPQNYPYESPPQQNGFYQAPPGNMGYPYPMAAAGLLLKNFIITIKLFVCYAGLGHNNWESNAVMLADWSLH